MTQTEKLARLHNRGTRYELALINGDMRILVMYSNSQSRRSIMESVRKHGPAIVTLANGAENIQFDRKASNGATIGAWQVRFTGRTQRDAIMEGELPWIGATAAVARVFDVTAEVAATALAGSREDF